MAKMTFLFAIIHLDKWIMQHSSSSSSLQSWSSYEQELTQAKRFQNIKAY